MKLIASIAGVFSVGLSAGAVLLSAMPGPAGPRYELRLAVLGEAYVIDSGLTLDDCRPYLAVPGMSCQPAKR